MPIHRAVTLPCSEWTFAPIWSPMTGKFRSAEARTACWATGSFASTKPRMVTASSSSGKSDTKP